MDGNGSGSCPVACNMMRMKEFIRLSNIRRTVALKLLIIAKIIIRKFIYQKSHLLTFHGTVYLTRIIDEKQLIGALRLEFISQLLCIKYEIVLALEFRCRKVCFAL